MNDLVFLDTETTGPDFMVDRLFQVSYMHNGKLNTQFFKPPVPISVKAQSITHITNKMVEDKEEFAYSEMKKELNNLFPDHILVAHNAAFDMDILLKEGVIVDKFICTLKVARFIDEASEIPEYKLQFLRYYFGLEIDAGAHDAEGDVKVLEAVFQVLYGKMLEKYGTHEAVISKMVEVSAQPTLFKMFNFGKHKGKFIEEVLGYDRPYMEWLLTKKLESDINDEDWIFTLKYHLKIS
jgi:exodeoxyribonuclease X